MGQGALFLWRSLATRFPYLYCVADIVGFGDPAAVGWFETGTLMPTISLGGFDAAGNPIEEKTIRPSDLQGGQLLPLQGDRSLTGGQLLQVGDTPLTKPVSLEGGHGFMPANIESGAAWAAAPGIAARIGRTVEGLGTERPTYGVYTAMSPRSVDFSHHSYETLADLVSQAKIPNAAKSAFDAEMKKTAADWPGVSAKNLREYLASAPGAVRDRFAKLIDTRAMQERGFPSAAEARFAVTDPRLLDVPTGASGLSIARMDPTGKRFPGAHPTYEMNVAGQYVGGLPTSVPKEVMYPDVVKSLEKYRGQMTGYQPTIDYLMSRLPVGQPVVQHTNQKWVDRLSKYLEGLGYTGMAITPAAVLAGASRENQ